MKVNYYLRNVNDFKSILRFNWINLMFFHFILAFKLIFWLVLNIHYSYYCFGYLRNLCFLFYRVLYLGYF